MAEQLSKRPKPGPVLADTLATTSDALRRTYDAAKPFRHVVVRPLCDDELLKRARREAIDELKADYKETDLFKVYQVPQDLGKIEMQAPELAEKAPALLRVRDAL